MKTEAIRLIQQVEQKSFNEGFKAGWYAAAQHMQKALKEPIMPISFEDTKKSAQPDMIDSIADEPHAAVAKNPFRSGTASSNVYEYVKANPGAKGIDIFNALGIKTKIGRTALYRMKASKIAVNQDGWRLTDR